MKKCKSCQTEIDDKAKKCPQCKTDQRNFFLKHKILTGILVIILITILANSGNKSSSKTPVSDNSKVIPTPMIITARQLADDFDANQVSAESKWGDKLVEFSAKISNITDYGLSFSDVASKDFSMAQISCKIKDKQQVMSLKNGETVKVRGIIGKQTIGVIDMADCEVAQ